VILPEPHPYTGCLFQIVSLILLPLLLAYRLVLRAWGWLTGPK
jgi:hypothetical protein